MAFTLNFADVKAKRSGAAKSTPEKKRLSAITALRAVKEEIETGEPKKTTGEGGRVRTVTNVLIEDGKYFVRLASGPFVLKGDGDKAWIDTNATDKKNAAKFVDSMIAAIDKGELDAHLEKMFTRAPRKPKAE